jgi:hypothetical protein
MNPTKQILTRDEQTIVKWSHKCDSLEAALTYIPQLNAIIGRLCAENAALKGEWINCSERLPDHDPTDQRVVWIWKESMHQVSVNALRNLPSFALPTHWHPDTRPEPPKDTDQ